MFPPHLPPCGIPTFLIYTKRSGITSSPPGERKESGGHFLRKEFEEAVGGIQDRSDRESKKIGIDFWGRMR
jgi:hypothetical protein